MARYKRIAILTGAGVSAESGLGTFRDTDGIWAKFDPYKVATPEAFGADPKTVLDFYNTRRANLAGAKPNAAHYALARLEHEYRDYGIGHVVTITQNVDDLHEKAGAANVIHMHGILSQNLCNACGVRRPQDGALTPETVCAVCSSVGTVRPDVVWFGEVPYQMERIQAELLRCNLFISVGTSGSVYPANTFVKLANDIGAHTVELNLEPSEGDYLFAECRYGPASEIVPAYVEELLA
jgi:NAD-dependent deacetylase